MENPDRPTILIVDDSPANITLLVRILSPQYQVQTAQNGAKGLESVEKNPPDLVLLDIMMPGLDGYEVCRRLKENPATRMIPVLFVTALNDDVDEARGFEAGALDYLTKPVTPLVVRARVKTHLDLSLAQRKLEKQNEILQEIIRLREDVERITSDDLKSPLTAFLNIPAMLMRDLNQTPDQIELLGVLQKSGYRMLEMINRSQDLFRMERGTYRLQPVPVDLVKVIRLILTELGSLASEKKIETSFLLEGAPVTEASECVFPGEEFLFFSMLSNLIKNALEASPEGGKVGIHLHSPEGASIEVKNQGEIPVAIRERFLERYATFGKKGAIGLGGYSARLMARTLGGELHFQSAKETGTLLAIDLPESLPALPAVPSPDQGTSPSTVRRSDMEVLVADDYGYMRKTIGDALCQMGFGHIQEAENVLQAQAFLEKTTFDLIVCDWNMPDKPGFELLKTLRARPDGANVPFLFLTGRPKEEIMVLSRKYGATDVLAKPFSPDILKTVIAGMFDANG